MAASGFIKKIKNQFQKLNYPSRTSEKKGVGNIRMESIQKNMTPIVELKHGLKNQNMVGIILSIGELTSTKDGHRVCTCKIADQSGSIDFSVWNDASPLISTGDIIQIVGGYVNYFKNRLTIYVGRGGYLEKLGELCYLFNEEPYLSDIPPNENTQSDLLKFNLRKQMNSTGNQIHPIKLDQNIHGNPSMSNISNINASNIEQKNDSAESNFAQINTGNIFKVNKNMSQFSKTTDVAVQNSSQFITSKIKITKDPRILQNQRMANILSHPRDKRMMPTKNQTIYNNAVKPSENDDFPQDPRIKR